MAYVIGLVPSAGVALFARYVGFDRDRAFYPTVMIVIASYYVLFAAMSGSVQTVVIESMVMMLFAAAAVAGFKSSAWIVVVALAGHGVFDAVHGHVIADRSDEIAMDQIFAPGAKDVVRRSPGLKIPTGITPGR